ncbi:MAG: NACHT domain-containing protein [Cyanobacteria bacterium P01_H01_bin.26]
MQKEAFVERLADIELSDIVVAKILNISRERYSSRMTQVYKKFNMPAGNIPGKARHLFLKVLDMYQRDNPSDAAVSQIVNDAIDDLVRDTQEKTRGLIQEKCSNMKILDMSQPIGVQDIFIEVNITKQISSKRNIELSELVKIIQQRHRSNDPKANRSRLFEEVKLSGVELLENCPKLLILGRPGAGKTTFLKYVAVFTNKSEILPGHVPIFISLKDFQEQDNQVSLKTYIENELSHCSVSQESFNRLLQESKVIFLLDGLDEVRKEAFNRVSREIKEISQVYNHNRFIITCRLAASEYKFESFLEAEVCEFTEAQVQMFARNWFTARNSPQKTEKFISRVKSDKEISELSTNPLLLTLLCMVFEDSEEFPKNQSELYKEGLDVLLRRWDVSRAIERPETYRKLSKNKKEDLLSKIAYATFQKNEGLFKKRTIENEIRDYILNLPRSISAPEEVEPDCSSVLKSMVAQHGLIVEVAKGIYSFSHRTFHEYFVSLKIVKTLDPEEQKMVLESLAIHIGDYRWQEVFLLVSCMLPKADYLLRLIKHRIDKIVEESEKISSFMSWLDQKSSSTKSDRNIGNLKSIAQVFYFNLIVRERITSSQRVSEDFVLDSNLIDVIGCCLEIQNNIELSSGLSSQEKIDEAIYQLRRNYKDLFSCMKRCISTIGEGSIREQFESLQKELPIRSKSSYDLDKSNQWWTKNGKKWSDRFRSIAIENRNIGHDWGFTKAEKTALQEYYTVNKLLFSCLKSDCYVSRDVREEISRSTLLPIDKHEE